MGYVTPWLDWLSVTAVVSPGLVLVTSAAGVSQYTITITVRAHKLTYFRSGWAHYETAVPGSLHLVPSPEWRAQIEGDYRGMADMFMATPPSFETIMAELAGVER